MKTTDKAQLSRLENHINESEVRGAYIELFGLQEFSLEAGRVDLQGDNLWIEFKKNVNLKSMKVRARVLGQMLHYIYDAQFSGSKVKIPSSICIADANECIFYHTADFQPFLRDEFFMMKAPNEEKQELEKALVAKGELRAKVFNPQTELEDLRTEFEARKTDKAETVRKIITDENFHEIYKQWVINIGKYLEHSAKIKGISISLANLYIEDIAQSHKLVGNKLDIGGGIYEVDKAAYNRFWRIFYRPVKDKTLLEIGKKLDRLKDTSLRERQGVFYTPELYAAEGVHRIVQALGLSSKEDLVNYHIWDMCAGTGNLELSLPTECFDKLYMSTIDSGEVQAVQSSGWFDGANIFQYDYLNDDVDLAFGSADLLDDSLGWKLPRNLREALADKSNKWIILINPPYAESTANGERSKSGTATTKIKSLMQSEKLGKDSNELFMQFLYRAINELPKSILCLYSKVKFISSPSSEKFRKNHMDRKCLGGFLMHSQLFSGVKNPWLVMFSMWDLGSTSNEILEFDILDKNLEHIKILGKKKFSYLSGSRSLKDNTWIDVSKFRSESKQIVPPLNRYNAITKTKKALDKLPISAIGYMQNGANNVQQSAQMLSLFSSAFGNAHGHPVTRENFLNSLVTFSVRRVSYICTTWTADRDEFMFPNSELSETFVSDCVLFALFNKDNNTSALKSIEYNDDFYDIKNEFFPFPFEEITDSFRSLGFDAPREDRYAAKVIQGYELSPEAKEQYNAALDIYRLVYKMFDDNEFSYSYDFVLSEHLTSPDLGMKQVLAAFKYLSGEGAITPELYKEKFKRFQDARALLRDKIYPSIFEYGFLTKETWY